MSVCLYRQDIAVSGKIKIVKTFQFAKCSGNPRERIL